MTNLAELMRTEDLRQAAQAIAQPKPALLLSPWRLPPHFRVESVARYPAANHQVLSRVKLFSEKINLTVEYCGRHVDSRITRGALVSIRWLGHPSCYEGPLRINRLVLMERAEASINLFDLVPPSWVSDRVLVKRAADLLASLPRYFSHLFNAVFWDGDRFERFVTGPSSLNGHHNYRNGNLRHSVEVADLALLQGCGREAVLPQLMALTALLHDAGKADEYRYDHGRRGYVLSERGELIGHRQTLLEWLATARAQHRVLVPEAYYLALLHVMTAVKGAPDWLGLRIPRRLEAVILAKADSISSEADLFSRNAAGDGRAAQFHPHLGVRPYEIGAMAGVE